MTNPQNKETVQELLIQTNLDVGLELNLPATADYVDLEALLEKSITHLIDSDFERLLQVLYRIDIDELKVKKAFANPDSVANNLAKLILAREIQKIETRKKYRQ